MPTLSPQVTPFYGGGQVVNPANVIRTDGAPSNTFTQDKLGTLAVDNANGDIYGLASKENGQDAWVLLGGTSGAVDQVLGTINQVSVNTAGNVATVSLPNTIITPGTLTATGLITGNAGLDVTASGASILGGLLVGGGAAILGTVSINISGASTTTIGTGGTGAVNIGNATGNTAVTGSIVVSQAITATNGNISAINGDLIVSVGDVSIGLGDILVNAGNISTTLGNVSVGGRLEVNGGAATDYIGTATLVNGTVTVANTNIAAADQVQVTREGINGSTALGVFDVAITPATNFSITSRKSDATTETNDTSIVKYLIVRQT